MLDARGHAPPPGGAGGSCRATGGRPSGDAGVRDGVRGPVAVTPFAGGDLRGDSRGDPQGDLLSAADAALYLELRVWRAEEADTAGIPVFMILTDRRLRDIVRRRPASLAALGGISGIGHLRLQKHGRVLLEQLRVLLKKAGVRVSVRRRCRRRSVSQAPRGRLRLGAPTPSCVSSTPAHGAPAVAQRAAGRHFLGGRECERRPRVITNLSVRANPGSGSPTRRLRRIVSPEPVLERSMYLAGCGRLGLRGGQGIVSKAEIGRRVCRTVRWLGDGINGSRF